MQRFAVPPPDVGSSNIPHAIHQGVHSLLKKLMGLPVNLTALQDSDILPNVIVVA